MKGEFLAKRFCMLSFLIFCINFLLELCHIEFVCENGNGVIMKNNLVLSFISSVDTSDCLNTQTDYIGLLFISKRLP